MTPTSRSLLFVLLAAGQALPAQSAPSRSTRDRPAWRLAARGTIDVQSNDNVFLLPTSTFDRLSTPTASTLASARFRDMRQASDLITTIEGSVRARGPGLGGRRLDIEPTIRYDRYQVNTARSNVRLGLEVRQALGHEGVLVLDVEHRPSYFARNYLFDAVDVNGNGNISGGERRYAAGRYDESSANLRWRHRLRRDSRRQPIGVFVELGAGMTDRTNEAPFTGRDLRGPTGSAALLVESRRGLRSRSRVQLGSLRSPVLPQVVLIDEVALATDFSGNGRATDRNARVVTPVDRSRRSVQLSQELAVALGDRTTLSGSVDLRQRTFTSTQSLDVANNGRRDRRLGLGAELAYDVASAVQAQIGVHHDAQTLNRRTDLGAEGAVDDYSRTRAFVRFRLTP
jgi:hypothetical protein